MSRIQPSCVPSFAADNEDTSGSKGTARGNMYLDWLCRKVETNKGLDSSTWTSFCLEHGSNCDDNAAGCNEYGDSFAEVNPSKIAIGTGSFECSQSVSTDEQFAAAHREMQSDEDCLSNEQNDGSVSVLFSDCPNQSLASLPSRSPSLFSPDHSLTRGWSRGKSQQGLVFSESVTPGQFQPLLSSTPGTRPRWLSKCPAMTNSTPILTAPTPMNNFDLRKGKKIEVALPSLCGCSGVQSFSEQEQAAGCRGTELCPVVDDGSPALWTSSMATLPESEGRPWADSQLALTASPQLKRLQSEQMLNLTASPATPCRLHQASMRKLFQDKTRDTHPFCVDSCEARTGCGCSPSSYSNAPSAIDTCTREDSAPQSEELCNSNDCTVMKTTSDDDKEITKPAISGGGLEQVDTGGGDESDCLLPTCPVTQSFPVCASPGKNCRTLSSPRSFGAELVSGRQTLPTITVLAGSEQASITLQSEHSNSGRRFLYPKCVDVPSCPISVPRIVYDEHELTPTVPHQGSGSREKPSSLDADHPAQTEIRGSSVEHNQSIVSPKCDVSSATFPASFPSNVSNGFCMLSGREVCVSSVAMATAQRFLSETVHNQHGKWFGRSKFGSHQQPSSTVQSHRHLNKAVQLSETDGLLVLDKLPQLNDCHPSVIKPLDEQSASCIQATEEEDVQMSTQEISELAAAGMSVPMGHFSQDGSGILHNDRSEMNKSLSQGNVAGSNENKILTGITTDQLKSLGAFQTARGGVIAVSTKAMQRARRLLEEVDDLEAPLCKMTNLCSAGSQQVDNCAGAKTFTTGSIGAGMAVSCLKDCGVKGGNLRAENVVQCTDVNGGDGQSVLPGKGMLGQGVLPEDDVEQTCADGNTVREGMLDSEETAQLLALGALSDACSQTALELAAVDAVDCEAMKSEAALLSAEGGCAFDGGRRETLCKSLLTKDQICAETVTWDLKTGMNENLVCVSEQGDCQQPHGDQNSSKQEWVGFRSAAGQPLAVSSAAMEKAHWLLSEEGLCADDKVWSSNDVSFNSYQPNIQDSSVHDNGENSHERDADKTSGEEFIISSSAVFDEAIVSPTTDLHSPPREANEVSPLAAGGQQGGVSWASLVQVKSCLFPSNDRQLQEGEDRDCGASAKSSPVVNSNTASVSTDMVLRASSQLRVDSSEFPTSVHLSTTDTNQVDGFASVSRQQAKVLAESLGHARSLTKGGDVCGSDGELKSLSENALDVQADHGTGVSGDVNDQLDRDLTRSCSFSTAQSLATDVGFTGFTTAGGRSVSVSSGALARARALMDTVENDAAKSAREPPAAVTGFSTAGGRKLCVTEASLAHAQTLLETIDEDTTSPTECEKMLPVGLSTAGERKVNVSAEALAHARGCVNSVKGHLDRSVGFSVAGGQKARVSAQSLEHVSTLGNSIGKSKNDCHSVEIHSSANSQKRNLSGKMPADLKPVWKAGRLAAGLTGFSTAGGRKLSVSAGGLARAETLFKSIEEEKNGSLPSRIKPPVTVGFSTAGGQEVRVSAEALAFAKGLVESVEEETGSCTFENKPPLSVGFSTAGGQNVPVSAKALTFAKGLAESVGEDTDSCTSENKPLSSVGFSTAGGQKVPVSAKALAFAKGLAESVGEDTSSCTSENKSPLSVGFSTAGGRKVSVSAAALARARMLIEKDDDQDAPSLLTVPVPNQCTGFATTAGQGVGMSAEALAKAQRTAETDLLSVEGLDTSVGQMEKQPDSTQPEQRGPALPGGVSTAGGTHFGISSRAPAHAQQTAKCDVCSPMASITDITVTFSGRQQTVSYQSAAKQSRQITPSRPAASVDGSQADNGRVSSAVSPAHSHTNGKGHVPQTPKGFSSGLTSHMAGQSRGFQAFAPPQGIVHDRPVTWGRFTPQRSLPPSRTPTHTSAQRSTSPSGHGRGRRPAFNTPYRRCTPVARNTNSSSTEKVKPDQPLASTHTSEVKRVKPMAGQLLSVRLEGKRVSLHELTGEPPRSYTMDELLAFGVHPSTLAINSQTAQDHRFVFSDFASSAACAKGYIFLADGGRVTAGQDQTIGWIELKEALYSTPGVEEQLISTKWVQNHYRWIVWQLAALEVCFPQWFAGRLLTPEQVLLRLKYRYDREIDNSQRSALKKVLEHDHSPSHMMVLCVSTILASQADKTVKPGGDREAVNSDLSLISLRQCMPDGGSKDTSMTSDNGSASLQPTVELTDGWYSINAVFDAPLQALLAAGKITVGCKLCVCGAELIGAAHPTTPLEAPPSVMLRLSANSTRRARWDARLGFQHQQPFPCAKLCSLFASGGHVACIEVLVQRKYPLLFVEKTTGRSIVRNSRAEERAVQTFLCQRERHLEELYEKLMKDIEEEQTAKRTQKSKGKQKVVHLSTEQLEDLCTGSQLYKAASTVPDPEDFEFHLNEEQRSALCRYRRSLVEDRQSELQARLTKAFQTDQEGALQRPVSPLLCVRLVGLSQTASKQEETGTILSVWRPSDDVEHILEEGNCVRIYTLNASPPNESAFSWLVSDLFADDFRVHRYSGSVQLTALRNTRYQQLQGKENVTRMLYRPRQVMEFSDLERYGAALLPPFNELDVVGVVVLCTDSHLNTSVSSFSRQAAPSVFLANASHQLVSIRVWQSLEFYAIEDILVPGNVVAVANLQWSNRQLGVPTLRANDMTAFSLNPRHRHLHDAVQALTRKLAGDRVSYVQTMADCAMDLMELRQQPHSFSLSPPAKGSQQRLPSATKAQFVSQGAALGGVKRKSDDFEQPSQQSSAAAAKRQRSTSLLDSIPSPPPLVQLPLSVPPSVRHGFKPPLRKTEHN